jgi:hypothetical protein
MEIKKLEEKHFDFRCDGCNGYGSRSDLKPHTKRCQKELNNYEKRDCNDCAADLNPGRDVDGVGCGPGRGESSPAKQRSGCTTPSRTGYPVMSDAILILSIKRAIS